MPRKPRKNQRIYLEGAEELDRELRRLSDRAQGRLLAEAAEAGAEVIREEAARLAPQDSGLLSETMTDAPRRLQIGRARIDVGISRNAWYGKLVELGTKFIPAQPFLRPSFDAKKDEAIAAVRKVLRKLIR